MKSVYAWILGAWLDSIRLRNVFGSAGCVEPGVVTPFKENTGDGDDESDVDESALS